MIYKIQLSYVFIERLFWFDLCRTVNNIKISLLGSGTLNRMEVTACTTGTTVSPCPMSVGNYYEMTPTFTPGIQEFAKYKIL